MNIREFIKTIPIKTFVEVGSHFGTDTQYFRSVIPEADIVCFEPDPRNLKVMKDRGVDKIANVYPYALSNVNGPHEFYLSNGYLGSRTLETDYSEHSKLLRENEWSCSSSLKKPTGHLIVHPWVTFPSRTVVNCIRLDDFTPLKDKIIDFMWIDVQGAEDIVFEGSKETLRRTRYVYTEYSNIELYEKQLNLNKLLSMYGPDWSVVYDYSGDILLKNNKL